MSNYSITFRAMGCQISAWLSPADDREAIQLSMLPLWFEAWEAALSRFRPDSELSRLNSQAGQWVRVSPVLMEVLRAAVHAAEITDGLVTPLILPALEAAGYDHSFEPSTFVPGPDQHIPAIPDWHEIMLDLANHAVRIPAGARLDLGGIGKGWAAQQAANRLSAYGPCLINAGGDMVARGTPDASGGWLISVPSPSDDPEQDRCHVLLRDAAIATSGTDYRRWQRGDQMLHHLIDPRTGRPADTDTLTATVITDDAVEAEAWAKAALIGGVLPDLPVLLVQQDGSLICTIEFDMLWKEISHVYS